MYGKNLNFFTKSNSKFSDFIKKSTTIFAQKVFILLIFMAFLCLINTNNVYASTLASGRLYLSPSVRQAEIKNASGVHTCHVSFQDYTPNISKGTYSDHVIVKIYNADRTLVGSKDFGVYTSQTETGWDWNKGENTYSWKHTGNADIKITPTDANYILYISIEDTEWHPYAMEYQERTYLAYTFYQYDTPKFQPNSYVQNDGNLT